MIANLEEELDVRIFDRNNRHVETTAIGQSIIAQARNAVMEAERIREIVSETRDTLSGRMRLAVGPSIAPYILPQFIKIYGSDYPDVSLTIEEMRPEGMFAALSVGRIDAAIAIGGNSVADLYEIPLYDEPFWVYLSDTCSHKLTTFSAEELSHESMWIMKEAQCLRDSAFSFCKARAAGRRVCVSLRRVSMYIRHDYVRERMLNSVAATLARVVPSHMLRPGIVKNGIRLR